MTDILDESVSLLSRIGNLDNFAASGVSKTIHHLHCHISLSIYRGRCGVLFIDAWPSRATGSINE